MDTEQTKAYPGEWVLKGGEGFKVYKIDAFEKSFQKLERIHPNQLEIEMDLRIYPNQLEIDGDPEEVSLGGELVHKDQGVFEAIDFSKSELVHKDQGVFEAIDFSKSELAVAEVTP